MKHGFKGYKRIGKIECSSTDLSYYFKSIGEYDFTKQIEKLQYETIEARNGKDIVKTFHLKLDQKDIVDKLNEVIDRVNEIGKK